MFARTRTRKLSHRTLLMAAGLLRTRTLTLLNWTVIISWSQEASRAKYRSNPRGTIAVDLSRSQPPHRRFSAAVTQKCSDILSYLILFSQLLDITGHHKKYAMNEHYYYSLHADQVLTFSSFRISRWRLLRKKKWLLSWQRSFPSWKPRGPPYISRCEQDFFICLPFGFLSQVSCQVMGVNPP